MPKKKILFVNYSLHSGGIEKSLVTLLKLFDYSKYSVDLQLFVHEGLFLKNVPHEVNLLKPLLPAEYKLNIRKAFLALLKMKMPKTAFCRLLVTLVSRNGTLGERLNRVYCIEKKLLKPNQTEYDAVIAFMEGQPLYYAVDFINAKKKIGFIHGDYEAMGMQKSIDEDYFAKLDNVCTVSDSCRQSLDEVFPENKAKHRVIYNIVSKKAIEELACSESGFSDGFRGKRILTIARLSYQKGLDVGINAVSLATKSADAPNFKWYIIGIGPEEAALKALCEQNGISDKVIFLGEKANPYPYLGACDIYFQPSRFEGKAIAVDEACALCKPILLADYSTARDQLTNGKEGVIVPLEANMLASMLNKMLTDDSLCKRLSENLSLKDTANEDEILKLYDLID